MATTFLRIYPILSTTEVPRDIAWWEEKTGFTRTSISDDSRYACVGRQGIYLHLQWHSGDVSDPVERSAIRIEVENLRPLFEEFVQRGVVNSDAFRERTAWGTNEFGFYDLNGNAIFFFEAL
jgi:hypothetical protein